MAIGAKIVDGSGSHSEAKVTKRGQLITAPLDFSTFYNAEVDVINTGFTIVTPRGGKQFVITSLIVYANKLVGTGDATVEIYEADSLDSTVVSASIFKQEMLKQTNLPLGQLNVIVSEGKWVNVKTDDNTIFVNMAGYYVDVE